MILYEQMILLRYIGKPNVIIIDLRDKSEFDIGHIPGAVNIPYEELEDHINNLQSKICLYSIVIVEILV